MMGFKMNWEERNVLSILLIVVLWGVVCQAQFAEAQAISIYVAPNGSGRICSEMTPCSLIEGRNVIRTMNANMTENIIVYLRGGRYVLEETFTLKGEDSGTSGYQVIYAAYPGEVPQISGGKMITGWIRSQNGIYKAAYSGPVFRELYVNGQRAIRARIPNQTNPDDLGPYYRLINWKNKGTITINANEIANWRGLNAVEMVIKKHWDQSRLRVASYQVDGAYAAVTPMEPERDIEWSCFAPQKALNQTYYFENSVDLLDAEGEWFYDEGAKMVYYKPRDGENMATVDAIAPAIDLLVDINGASDIQFQGIVFEHSRYMLADNMRIGCQAGFRVTEQKTEKGQFIPGGIRLVNAYHIRFEGNTIRHLGGSGLEFFYATHHNVIHRNTITDISNNGIIVYTNFDNTTFPNPPDDQTCQFDVISHNLISKVGQEYTGSAGILATYPKGITITHNEIFNMPYQGIGVGWGWTTQTTALQDNLIQYNNVHHVMQLHDDGAGIYTLSCQPGTMLLENWIHDLSRSPWAEGFPISGIYLDEGSTGITVEHNVITNVPEVLNLHQTGQNTYSHNNTQDQEVKDNAGPQ